MQSMLRGEFCYENLKYFVIRQKLLRKNLITKARTDIDGRYKVFREVVAPGIGGSEG